MVDAFEVVLIGCCGKKGAVEAPARELYQSALFKLSREYAELRGAPWAILSAKHGLVMPDRYLEPYDFTFADRIAASPRECRSRKFVFEEWGREVQQELRRRWPGARFTLLAGEQYAVCLSSLDTVVTEGRSTRTGGLLSHEPLAGMQVGQRLSWLKREAADLRAASSRREAQAAQGALLDPETGVRAGVESVPSAFPARFCESCKVDLIDGARFCASCRVEDEKRLAEIASEVELAECDFCGEPLECAVSEIGHKRFEGDDVPARICEGCATWALEKIRAGRVAVPA